MDIDLSGRVVAVTGASSGIGEATALACAAPGVRPAKDVTPLDPDDVARAIVYVIGQPDGVAVSEMLVRPSSQVS